MAASDRAEQVGRGGELFGLGQGGISVAVSHRHGRGVGWRWGRQIGLRGSCLWRNLKRRILRQAWGGFEKEENCQAEAARGK